MPEITSHIKPAENHTRPTENKPAEKTIAHEHKGKVLLPIARAVISDALGRKSQAVDENQPWLHDKGASFVTLTMNQHLRGCIGSLEAHRPLLLDVKANAYAAAFRDPRFSPLTIAELDTTEIEISLLSPQQPIYFKNEADALAQLQPQIDGVVFKYGHYRSTFLPQVWEQLTDSKTFIAHLKHKAGLHPEFWHDDVELYRYTVTKFKEKDLQAECNSNTESLAS
jgi:AmmeMemoRadiSam system protein A